MSKKKVISYKRETGKKIGNKHVYYVGLWDDLDQKYIRRATEFTNKAKAEELGWIWFNEGLPNKSKYLYEYLEEFWLETSDYVVAKRAENAEALCQEYLEASQRQIEKHIKRFIKDIPVEGVTPAMIKSVLTGMHKEGYSRNTINNVLKPLTVSLNNYWEQLGKPERSPARFVKLLTIKKIDREIFSLEEVTSFFTCLIHNHKHSVINKLAAFGGMRVSEICGLKRDQLVHVITEKLDFYRIDVIRQANGRTPKGGKGSIVIPTPLGMELEKYYEEETRRNGFFFEGKTKNLCIGKKVIEVIFNETVCNSLEITDEERKQRGLTFHAWRHFFVTYVEHEDKKRTAMVMARHKTADMTAMYRDENAEIQSDNANMLDDIYDRALVSNQLLTCDQRNA